MTLVELMLQLVLHNQLTMMRHHTRAVGDIGTFEELENQVATTAKFIARLLDEHPS